MMDSVTSRYIVFYNPPYTSHPELRLPRVFDAVLYAGVDMYGLIINYY